LPEWHFRKQNRFSQLFFASYSIFKNQIEKILSGSEVIIN
jgi:hypothetical protein